MMIAGDAFARPDPPTITGDEIVLWNNGDPDPSKLKICWTLGNANGLILLGTAVQRRVEGSNDWIGGDSGGHCSEQTELEPGTTYEFQARTWALISRGGREVVSDWSGTYTATTPSIGDTRDPDPPTDPDPPIVPPEDEDEDEQDDDTESEVPPDSDSSETDTSEQSETPPPVQVYTAPSPQPAPEPPRREPEPPPPLPVADPSLVLMTEWVLIDFGRSVPQWIELYNYNNIEIDLEGWTFEYIGWHRHRATLKSVTLTDFRIPAKSAVILVTYPSDILRGLEPSHVYNLGIPVSDGTLKNGWRISDSEGNIIHEIGSRMTDNRIGNPPAGTFVNGARNSVQVYKSADAPEVSYYGHKGDIGSPGFFELVRSAPAQRRIVIRKWASLRK